MEKGRVRRKSEMQARPLRLRALTRLERAAACASRSCSFRCRVTLPPAIGSARDNQDGRLQCSSTRRHADQRQNHDNRALLPSARYASSLRSSSRDVRGVEIALKQRWRRQLAHAVKRTTLSSLSTTATISGGSCCLMSNRFPPSALLRGALMPARPRDQPSGHGRAAAASAPRASRSR